MQAADEFEKQLPALKLGIEKADPEALRALGRFLALRERALLANPVLDFEDLLLVRRREDNLALPQNWQGEFPA